MEVFETGLPVLHESSPVNGRIYQTSEYPFNDIDGTPLALKLYIDITDRKQAEIDRIKTEKLQVVLEMAGAACHEFNQPLQVIVGNLELLRETGGEAQNGFGERLSRIEEQVARMRKITETLKKITRYKTKDYFLGKKIIDIDGSAG